MHVRINARTHSCTNVPMYKRSHAQTSPRPTYTHLLTYLTRAPVSAYARTAHSQSHERSGTTVADCRSLRHPVGGRTPSCQAV
eukprot:6213515-Pleurochrysis_carterae.AAC.3